MSRHGPILRRVVMAEAPRVLGLPVASSVPALPHASTPSLPDSSPREDEYGRGHAAGYDKGVQDGFQRADQEARLRAEQAAQELADVQVREALAQAEAQAQQHTRTLQASLTRQIELLESMLGQLPAQTQARLEEAEDDMLALAFEAVCRVLGDQAVSLDGLRAQLQTCLKNWHGRAPLSLHLHPDDLATLQSDPATVEMLVAAGFHPERNTLRWVADAKVTSGGCLLKSSEGALDARLDIQLQALKASLLRTRASRKHLAALPAAAPTETP